MTSDGLRMKMKIKITCLCGITLLLAACAVSDQHQTQQNQLKLAQIMTQSEEETIWVVVQDGLKKNHHIAVKLRRSDPINIKLTEQDIVRMVNQTSLQYAPLLFDPEGYIPLSAQIDLYSTVADTRVDYSLLDQRHQRVTNAYRKYFPLQPSDQ